MRNSQPASSSGALESSLLSFILHRFLPIQYTGTPREDAPIPIDALSPQDEQAYQEYILRHPDAVYCHDIAWLRVIRETYGKEPVYLVSRASPKDTVRGVLPAFFLRNPVFGRSLVSLPYLDFGGPLGDTPEVQRELTEYLVAAAQRFRARAEIRCARPLPWLEPSVNQKVGMTIDLSATDESTYWKKLDNKVRNQVRKAEKSQVAVRWGGQEQLEAFYDVFARNMRDLGSPVHARSLFSNLLREMPGAEIGTAWREGRCIGGLVRILWRNQLAIPWASTLREERIHCPNNALYWESIRHAFAEGCSQVDLGRSTRGEGTYRFKQQWMAVETPLAWYQFDALGQPTAALSHVSSSLWARATSLWEHLPLRLANLLGPRIRSHISA